MVNPDSLRPCHNTLGPAAGPACSKILAPPLPAATNTNNGQKFATSQHLDMSRCWALTLRCGKFVVELL